MQVVVIAAAKGGVGKSTLTAGLATAAALEAPDITVGVVDLDPQGSLTRWGNARQVGRPTVFDLRGLALPAALAKLRAAGVSLLFVDCPPGFTSILEEAISVADLVLVPTQASPLDLAAIASTVAMAERAGVAYRTVLNRAVFRSRIAGATVQALRERGNFLWPPIHQRVDVASAMASGRTVQEVHPAGAAAREIAALWAAVRAILDAPPPGRPPVRWRLPVMAAAPRRGT